MKEFTLKFDREDLELTTIRYKITLAVTAESEEEARQLIISGDYLEEDRDIEDYEFLGLGDCDETLEEGEVDPETIEVVECRELD